jgi:hypothetical protein
MKGTLIGAAVLCVCAAAFAFGAITVARSAENDINSALGRDSATGLPYLRVFVVNSGNSQVAPASPSLATASLSQTVTLTEGSRFPMSGRLTSAVATGRPCDLIVSQGGRSQLILIAPSGTSLNDMPVAGIVFASGNPFGYACSLVLKYTAP